MQKLKFSNEKKTPDEWAKKFNITILDPDGWRFKSKDYEAKDFSEEIGLKEFLDRLNVSTMTGVYPDWAYSFLSLSKDSEHKDDSLLTQRFDNYPIGSQVISRNGQRGIVVGHYKNGLYPNAAWGFADSIVVMWYQGLHGKDSQPEYKQTCHFLHNGKNSQYAGDEKEYPHDIIFQILPDFDQNQLKIQIDNLSKKCELIKEQLNPKVDLNKELKDIVAYWDLYQQDTKPETRNDFLREFSKKIKKIKKVIE